VAVLPESEAESVTDPPTLIGVEDRVVVIVTVTGCVTVTPKVP
jgi:hypothetical protein